jgi:hypothetical protein
MSLSPFLRLTKPIRGAAIHQHTSSRSGEIDQDEVTDHDCETKDTRGTSLQILNLDLRTQKSCCQLVAGPKTIKKYDVTFSFNMCMNMCTKSDIENPLNSYPVCYASTSLNSKTSSPYSEKNKERKADNRDRSTGMLTQSSSGSPLFKKERRTTRMHQFVALCHSRFRPKPKVHTYEIVAST